MVAEPAAPAMPPELAAAIVAALGELDDVTKTRTAAAGQYTYRYATLGDVLGAARPVLARHGLALCQYVDVQSATDRGVTVAVHTRLVHTSGHVLEVPALSIAAAATAQAIGSAATYGRRYQAMAVLGVAGGDDDDGAAASAGTATAPQRQASTPPTSSHDAIRATLFSLPLDVRLRVQAKYQQERGGNLLDRAADPDAVLAWLDVEVRDAADRASADAAHVAVDQPDEAPTL